jgi:membrane protein implicated in regulation of membrane protease activity
MRLQDIAALRGPSGLLATLQKTALLMAVIGIAVAIIGFVCTLMSGQVWYTFTAGVVAAAILLFYGYPLRPSWEQAVQRYSSSENSTNLVESES